MLKIGDFAKQARVSAKLLRHYDTIGLLKPIWIDPETEYRYYALTQLPRLNRILALKDLGFSLKQISVLLNGDLSAGQLKTLLQMRRVELETHIAQERQRLAQVETRLQDIDAEAILLSTDVVLQSLPSQAVASLRKQFQAELLPDLPNWIDQVRLYVAWHAALRQTPITIVFHEETLSGCALEIEIVVPTAHLLPAHREIRTYQQPEARLVASLLASRCNVAAACDKLYTWVENHGYVPTGNYREVYWQGISTHLEVAQHTTLRDSLELQVPIQAH